MLLVGKEEILLAIILPSSEQNDSSICLPPWYRLKNIISIDLFEASKRRISPNFAKSPPQTIKSWFTLTNPQRLAQQTYLNDKSRALTQVESKKWSSRATEKSVVCGNLHNLLNSQLSDRDLLLARSIVCRSHVVSPVDDDDDDHGDVVNSQLGETCVVWHNNKPEASFAVRSSRLTVAVNCGRFN